MKYKIDGQEVRPSGEEGGATTHDPAGIPHGGEQPAAPTAPQGYEPSGPKREAQRKDEEREQPLNPFGDTAAPAATPQAQGGKTPAKPPFNPPLDD